MRQIPQKAESHLLGPVINISAEHYVMTDGQWTLKFIGQGRNMALLCPMVRKKHMPD